MTPSNSHGVEVKVDLIHKALANPLRRQILAWLKYPDQHFAQNPCPVGAGVCASQIAARTTLSQSTVSAHLASLYDAGLLSSYKVGQWIFYRRNDDIVDQFRSYMQQL